MKLVSQIAFICIFIVGVLVGVKLGVTLLGLSIGLVTNLLEWGFPQYVIPNPVDYAGPLPNVATIIVLGVAWLSFAVSLRKFHNWIKVGFDKAKEKTLSGHLLVGLPIVLVLTSVFGTYFSYFAFSLIIALLTLTAIISQRTL